MWLGTVGYAGGRAGPRDWYEPCPCAIAPLVPCSESPPSRLAPAASPWREEGRTVVDGTIAWESSTESQPAPAEAHRVPAEADRTAAEVRRTPAEADRTAAEVRRTPAEAHRAPAESHRTPILEVVNGSIDPEPVAHGLRAVRELLDAPDCVLFAILPDGL